MNSHKIQSLEQLRAIIGDEIPGLHEKNIDHVDEFARDFIEKSPLIVLSTADESGRMDASPKGDAPGFVEVLNEHTLLIPDRPGNKLAYGHQNILSNPNVGILFIVPNTRETLRINGRAELSCEPGLLQQLAARDKPATLVIRVFVDECFFHCGKAMLRSKLWDSSTWQENFRVSFGEIFAARKVAGSDVAKSIDQRIEADYRDNL
ncbi:pyridoxamine 5'-phosphate oxidase family protein [Gammaproteobacteria bacterium]|nr:pyridoxamine 5'-phosphate oxidase family protein [Gammaproteobacteria bacterium]